MIRMNKMTKLMIHHIFNAVLRSFDQSFIKRHYTFIRQTAAPTGSHITRFQLRKINSIRNEFLMNFMHYFIEDDTALFIQPAVEKILFSVIIVGSSYMDANINAVGIYILLCIFDNAYPHIFSEKCNIFSADILHFSFKYLIAFKSINSISDIPALTDNKRICYILSNILRH